MIEKKLLEKKDWAYYVYEVDNCIALSVPIPKPTPGFDVVHILSESEKEKYLNKGIQFLEGRIEDMKMNFYNYEMNSWK
ncbi:hypothetical protein N6B72_17280 [Chryseobacterium soli]|uniref:hypothetical protein n=1 Tax=Chryseobacterium soli TaxID=445961 RepID=UPI002954C697|nr:hypothetical protein [Chryseobacterium soli]MDV7698680.1 hypothetical protein [Chryseobacterium soli]